MSDIADFLKDMHKQFHNEEIIEKNIDNRKIDYTQNIANCLGVSDNNWSDVNIEDIVDIIYRIQNERCWQANENIYINLKGKRLLNCTKKNGTLSVNLDLEEE